MYDRRRYSLDSVTTDDDEDDRVSMEGYLQKRGGGRSMLGRQSWKERYFVLHKDGTLSYYRTRGEYELGGAPVKAPVDTCKCVVRADPSARAAGSGPVGGGLSVATGATATLEFVIETSKVHRVWVFRARKATDKLKWLSAFAAVGVGASRSRGLGLGAGAGAGAGTGTGAGAKAGLAGASGGTTASSSFGTSGVNGRPHSLAVPAMTRLRGDSLAATPSSSDADRTSGALKRASFTRQSSLMIGTGSKVRSKAIRRAGFLRVYFGPVKGWKQRWVSLEAGNLTCYANDLEKVVKWAVRVKFALIRPVPEHDTQFEVSVLRQEGGLGSHKTDVPSRPSKFRGLLSSLFSRRANRAAKLTGGTAKSTKNVVVRNGNIITAYKFKAANREARDAWLTDIQTVALDRTQHTASPRGMDSPTMLHAGAGAQTRLAELRVRNSDQKRVEARERRLEIFASEQAELDELPSAVVLHITTRTASSDNVNVALPVEEDGDGDEEEEVEDIGDGGGGDDDDDDGAPGSDGGGGVATVDSVGAKPLRSFRTQRSSESHGSVDLPFVDTDSPDIALLDSADTVSPMLSHQQAVQMVMRLTDLLGSQFWEVACRAGELLCELAEWTLPRGASPFHTRSNADADTTSVGGGGFVGDDLDDARGTFGASAPFSDLFRDGARRSSFSVPQASVRTHKSRDAQARLLLVMMDAGVGPALVATAKDVFGLSRSLGTPVMKTREHQKMEVEVYRTQLHRVCLQAQAALARHPDAARVLLHNKVLPALSLMLPFQPSCLPNAVDLVTVLATEPLVEHLASRVGVVPALVRLLALVNSELFQDYSLYIAAGEGHVSSSGSRSTVGSRAGSSKNRSRSRSNSLERSFRTGTSTTADLSDTTSDTGGNGPGGPDSFPARTRSGSYAQSSQASSCDGLEHVVPGSAEGLGLELPMGMALLTLPELPSEPFAAAAVSPSSAVASHTAGIGRAGAGTAAAQGPAPPSSSVSVSVSVSRGQSSSALPSSGNSEIWQGKGWAFLCDQYADAVLTQPARIRPSPLPLSGSATPTATVGGGEGSGAGSSSSSGGGGGGGSGGGGGNRVADSGGVADGSSRDGAAAGDLFVPHLVTPTTPAGPPPPWAHWYADPSSRPSLPTPSPSVSSRSLPSAGTAASVPLSPGLASPTANPYFVSTRSLPRDLSVRTTSPAESPVDPAASPSGSVLSRAVSARTVMSSAATPHFDVATTRTRGVRSQSTPTRGSVTNTHMPLFRSGSRLGLFLQARAGRMATLSSRFASTRSVASGGGDSHTSGGSGGVSSVDGGGLGAAGSYSDVAGPSGSPMMASVASPAARGPLPSVSELEVSHGDYEWLAQTSSRSAPAGAADTATATVPASSKSLSRASSVRSFASSLSGLHTFVKGDSDDAAVGTALVALLSCLSMLLESPIHATEFCKLHGVAHLLQTLRFTQSYISSSIQSVPDELLCLLHMLSIHARVSDPVRDALLRAYPSLSDHLTVLVLTHYINLSQLTNPDDPRLHGAFLDITPRQDTEVALAVQLLWHLFLCSCDASGMRPMPFEVFLELLATSSRDRCTQEFSAATPGEWREICSALQRCVHGERGADAAVDSGGGGVPQASTPGDSFNGLGLGGDGDSGDDAPVPPPPPSTSTTTGASKPSFPYLFEDAKSSPEPARPSLPSEASLYHLLSRSGAQAPSTPPVSGKAVAGQLPSRTGMLRKRRLRGTWTKRWFILEEGVLSYYADAASRVIRGKVSLTDTVLTFSDHNGFFSGRQYRLTLSHPSWHHEMRLAAASPLERDAWVKVLLDSGAQLEEA